VGIRAPIGQIRSKLTYSVLRLRQRQATGNGRTNRKYLYLWNYDRQHRNSNSEPGVFDRKLHRKLQGRKLHSFRDISIFGLGTVFELAIVENLRFAVRKKTSVVFLIKRVGAFFYSKHPNIMCA